MHVVFITIFYWAFYVGSLELFCSQRKTGTIFAQRETAGANQGFIRCLLCLIKIMAVCVVYIQYQNISNSIWICQKLAAEQLQTRASGRHGPSVTTQISHGWVTLLHSQPGEPPCWVISLAFGCSLVTHRRTQYCKSLASTISTPASISWCYTE